MEKMNINTSGDEEGSKQKKDSDLGSNDSDVSEPPRLRCPILYGVESDREFLWAYCGYFLPVVSIFVWCLFLLT